MVMRYSLQQGIGGDQNAAPKKSPLHWVPSDAGGGAFIGPGEGQTFEKTGHPGD